VVFPVLVSVASTLSPTFTWSSGFVDPSAITTCVSGLKDPPPHVAATRSPTVASVSAAKRLR
jgi:hypothetical protein